MLAYDSQKPLEDFLEENAGDQLRQTDSGTAGSPLALIIAASAVSANDFVKRLPRLNRVCRVAKLFAKHFKIEEQQKDLSTRPVNIASGTPNRMAKLAETGHLKLARLQLLLIDCALDAKNRTVLDVPEVCKDFWAFFQIHLKARTASGSVRMVLVDSSTMPV